MGWGKQVDLYENSRNANIKDSSTELCNRPKTIRVEITPSYYGSPGDPAVTGLPQIETFTIQSRGFSTPGFEAGFVVFALVAIAFIIKVYKRKQ